MEESEIIVPREESLEPHTPVLVVAEPLTKDNVDDSLMEPSPSSKLQHSSDTEGDKDTVKEATEEAPSPSQEEGGVTTTSETMESIKKKADGMRQQNGGTTKDIAKDMYHVKWIMFKGRRAPIVMQNMNGPCPLLAIVNVLLLKQKVVLEQSADVVTSSQLMGYIGDILLQAMPNNLPEGEQANLEQNVNDAIAVFHKLQTGLDVNVRFTGVKDFEYTPECVVFDLLNIPLFHGWLVDASLPDVVKAVGNLTYNQLVERVIENQGNIDVDKSTQAVLGQMFLDESASQLTYHGLAELSSTLGEDQMAVFFRNNHFSTIYKHRDHLFLLVTDQGYLRQSRIVWETLSNVEGDGELVNSEFRIPENLQPLPSSSAAADTKEQVDQDLLLALSLTNEEDAAHATPAASSHETDEAFAKRLQEEENRQAAVQHQQAERSADKQQRQRQPQHQHQHRQRQQPREEQYDHSPRQRQRKDSNSCVLL
ncbi:ubiquitin carboxyl-terminal hydrolase MINDY-2-like [Watersipora subatra]|uniref:ubiquitin carboxyl-terminal hydrolase MINDY-2-like n=1 Tax=Watersipora subatra TaxID=2589382 RepID=UPI00355C00E6